MEKIVELKHGIHNFLVIFYYDWIQTVGYRNSLHRVLAYFKYFFKLIHTLQKKFSFFND